MTQLYTIKTAAPAVSNTVGVSLRRQLQQRGFYRNPSPGMYGLREGFQAADRASHAKIAAAIAAARLFGGGDEIRGMTQLFKKRQLIPKKPDLRDVERGSGSRYSPPTNVRDVI